MTTDTFTRLKMFTQDPHCTTCRKALDLDDDSPVCAVLAGDTLFCPDCAPTPEPQPQAKIRRPRKQPQRRPAPRVVATPEVYFVPFEIPAPAPTPAPAPAPVPIRRNWPGDPPKQRPTQIITRTVDVVRTHTIRKAQAVLPLVHLQLVDEIPKKKRPRAA